MSKAPTLDQILRANGYENAVEAIRETMIGKSLRTEAGRTYRFPLFPKRLRPFRGDEIGTQYTTYVVAMWEPMQTATGEKWWRIMATIPGSGIDVEISKGPMR